MATANPAPWYVAARAADPASARPNCRSVSSDGSSGLENPLVTIARIPSISM